MAPKNHCTLCHSANSSMLEIFRRHKCNQTLLQILKKQIEEPVAKYRHVQKTQSCYAFPSSEFHHKKTHTLLFRLMQCLTQYPVFNTNFWYFVTQATFFYGSLVQITHLQERLSHYILAGEYRCMPPSSTQSSIEDAIWPAIKWELHYARFTPSGIIYRTHERWVRPYFCEVLTPPEVRSHDTDEPPMSEHYAQSNEPGTASQNQAPAITTQIMTRSFEVSLPSKQSIHE